MLLSLLALWIIFLTLSLLSLHYLCKATNNITRMVLPFIGITLSLPTTLTLSGVISSTVVQWIMTGIGTLLR